MTVDNSATIAPFIPETFDGDTFLYTELLNRDRKSGNNKGRRFRTFYHRDRAEFWNQMPDIVAWCHHTGARAYTRLSPRSFQKVGHVFAIHVTEQVLAANWEGMRHGYSHCCGISKPVTKYWLWDVDKKEFQFENWFPVEHLVTTIPSRQGFHVVTRPFDVRQINMEGLLTHGVQLHKDNPTNLYIPE